MGSRNYVITRTPTATAGNLTAKVGYIVAEANTSGEIALAASDTDKILGVLVGAENESQGIASVCVHGLCKVIAGEAFTPDTDSMFFTSNGSGKAVKIDSAVVLSGNAQTLVTAQCAGRILSKVAVAANDVVDALVYVTPFTRD